MNKPPTPTLDALWGELIQLLDWYTIGHFWHKVVVCGVLIILAMAFFKALASTDRPTVERIIREKVKQ